MIKDIYVIQDSHTDIGFTNTQGRILRWYSAYIRQAIEIAEANPHYRWTCETFLQVEQFWRHANEDWRQRFVETVQKGRISLSASWANFNELPDADLFESLALRAKRFADENRLPLNTAVMADINGCPLAHARALSKAGANLLLMHVNSWHGCPLRRRPMQSFWWDLGNGHKMLVYYNEHYHFGNELGLFPGAEANATNFNDPIAPFDETILDRRLPEFLNRIEKTDWPHEFLIVTGSAFITDNSPPGDAVVQRIARWNANPPRPVKIRMITASEIFGIVSSSAAELPTFSGDWTDWWADGVASDPEGIMLFRQAQRERRWLSAAGKTFPGAAVDFHALDTALGFFAEHTYGHCSAATSPWNPTAQQLHVRKMGYAGEAADAADCLSEEAGQAFGFAPPAPLRPLHFAVVNPHDEELTQLVDIEVDTCEAHYHGLGKALEIRDATTHDILPHQMGHSLRGIKAVVIVNVLR